MTVTGQVKAVDNDTDSWNSHIDYKIRYFDRQYPFAIDQETGVITTQIRDLDTSATFLFGVVASDRGRVSPLYSISSISFKKC